MAIVSALVAFSLLAGAVQDIKENQISDYTWIPAILGAMLMAYNNLNNIIFLVLKFTMITIILVVSYFFGGGIADMIGLAVLIIDDDPFAPIGTLIIFMAVTIPYAIFKILIKKERKIMIPLKDFMKKKNAYPLKVYLDGKEEKLPKTADKAYQVLETLLKDGKQAVVETEIGLPAVVPMCIGYVINMMISFYIGKSWIGILFNILGR
jgi:hypothetical protein